MKDVEFSGPGHEELAIYRRRQELEPDLIHLSNRLISAYDLLRPYAQQIKPEIGIRTKAWEAITTETPEFPLSFQQTRHIVFQNVIGGVLIARLSNRHELTIRRYELQGNEVPPWGFTRSRIVAPGKLEIVKVIQRDTPWPRPVNTTTEITAETRKYDEKALSGDTALDQPICGFSDYYDSAETYIDAFHKDTQNAIEEFTR